MNIPLLLHTLRHLRPRQVVWQAAYRLHKPRYKTLSAPAGRELAMAAPIAKAKCCEGEAMTFLNITMPFTGWEMTGQGMLWAYNLCYMDWLGQESMDAETGARWIDRFIGDLPAHQVGTDPYPTALRVVNWIKFISRHGGAVDAARRRAWDTALYSSCRHLERRLERHLLGNHLLEDAYALTWGALYFADRRLWRKATRLLRHELDEQLLADGAHYEQSPMYHALLTDRLLDCVNICAHNVRFEGQEALTAYLRERAAMMLGHLESIVYEDGTFPLFGDAARGIAPTPEDIFAYAHRLGLAWEKIPLGACGYRHLTGPGAEAFVDVGDIKASYQPGHAHADTFSYELRIDGRPFIVDTGISTYDKTPRRQYERGTAAHNTVSIDGRDSSEVWGGFRMGRRARVTLLKDTPCRIQAQHDGFRPHTHTRIFAMDGNDSLTVCDMVGDDDATGDETAHSHIHLAPGIKVEDIRQTYGRTIIATNVATIGVEGAETVSARKGETACEYNRLTETSVIDIGFSRGVMMYRINSKK